MNRFAWTVLGLCCAAPLTAQDVTVFVPSRAGDAPVYMNGELVRIDRNARTITLRAEGRQTVLTVEPEALVGMGALRPGSSVILGYRLDGSGRSARRIVTSVRSGSAASGTLAGDRKVTASLADSSPRTLSFTPRAEEPAVPPPPFPRGNGTVQGGTVGTGSVPQLPNGFPQAGINSQIPSIPPVARPSTAVLPPASVLPETDPPRTPAEAAAVRERASRDFDLAAAVLGARAAEMDRAWFAYRGSCVSSTAPLNSRSREWFGLLDGSITAPTDDVCEQAFAEVSRLAEGIGAQLDIARDSARRADVLPGRMRESLQRYNLDL